MAFNCDIHYYKCQALIYSCLQKFGALGIYQYINKYIKCIVGMVYLQPE